MRPHQTERVRLLAIVGPTGVGKTELALELADALPIEVISADSRQVYRYMDIGTAKPSQAQLSAVPHHLVSVVDPDYEFSLGDFSPRANTAVENANRTGRLPVLVGGTGQYVMSVLEGWNVPRVAPDPGLRQQLEDELRKRGLESLLDRLRYLDPEALQRVDRRNPRRVIRAIESAAAGQPSGRRERRLAPKFCSLVIGLTVERPELYRRIDDRVERMMGNGLLDEVQWLLASGYHPGLSSMSGIGYGELADHLMNGTDLDTAVDKIKFRTHRYVRQQSSWFRQNDPRIQWSQTSELRTAIDRVLHWASRADWA